LYCVGGMVVSPLVEVEEVVGFQTGKVFSVLPVS